MTAPLPCTVCDSPSVLERRIPDADLYRCPSCDHCFSGLRSMEAFEEYGPEYFERTHRHWFAHPNLALFAYVHRYIKTSAPDAAVIDVGSGRGDFLKYLRRASARLTLVGIDLSPPPTAEGIKFIQGDALTADIGRTFDVVVSLAAIEHVTDIHLFTRRLRELCAPGGSIIIMTNYERGLLYQTARALYSLGYRRPCERLYSRHHLNHFNTSSLTRLLSLHGLSVVRIYYHNTPIRAVDIPASSGMTEAVLRTMVWGVWLLGRLTRRTFLQTMVCRR